MTRKKKNPLAIKHRQIAKLATRALKDKFVVKPQKGYKYLKDLKNGSGFETPSGTAGILIDCHTNARVIIGAAPSVRIEDRASYLGRKIISGDTEVKEIK